MEPETSWMECEMRLTVRMISLTLTLLAAGGAAAAESYGPTDLERAMLPPYCGGPGGGDWAKILGPDRVWNNHTCYGINRINRYFRSRSATDKEYHLTTALKDFDYSVGHLPERFPLMPEILYYRGLTHQLMGRDAQAMADWLKSISMDKLYVKSITALADLYAKAGKQAKALELVTEGLRNSPEAKSLKRQYTSLGGKLPYPEAYVAKPVETPPAKAAEAVNSVSTEAEPNANVPASLPLPVQQQPAVPVTGSKTNPWCRFCVDPAPSKPTGEPKVSP